MGIPSIKIRRSLDRLIFIMGIPTLVVFKRPLIVQSIGYSEYTHNKTMSSNVVNIFLRIYSAIVINCCYSPDIVASPPQRIFFIWCRHDVVTTSSWRHCNVFIALIISQPHLTLSHTYMLHLTLLTFLPSSPFLTFSHADMLLFNAPYILPYLTDSYLLPNRYMLYLTLRTLWLSDKTISYFFPYIYVVLDASYLLAYQHPYLLYCRHVIQRLLSPYLTKSVIYS